MKWAFGTVLGAIALALIIGSYATAKLPSRVSENSGIWHDGSEIPPSYLTGTPLVYLTHENYPTRNNYQTAYYLIRGGIGGWYLALGEDTILMGFPDHWAEGPK
jgi:hypothetical protein